MLAILASARSGGHNFVESVFHSSELMPGGSPTFPTEESIEKLYRDLEILFQAGQQDFHPMTLGQYLQSTVTNGTVPDRLAYEWSHNPGKVLVLGTDTRAVLAVVRSLGRGGIDVHLAAESLDPLSCGRATCAPPRIPAYSGRARSGKQLSLT